MQYLRRLWRHAKADPQAFALGAVRALVVQRVFAPIHVAFLLNAGLGPAEISYALTTISVTIVLLDLPCSWLGDRFGSHLLLMRLGLLGLVATMVVLATIPDGASLERWLIPYGLFGLGLSLYFGNDSAFARHGQSQGPQSPREFEARLGRSLAIGYGLRGVLAAGLALVLVLTHTEAVRWVLWVQAALWAGALVASMWLREPRRSAQPARIYRQLRREDFHRFPWWLVAYGGTTNAFINLFPTLTQFGLGEAGVGALGASCLFIGSYTVVTIVTLSVMRLEDRLGPSSIVIMAMAMVAGYALVPLGLWGIALSTISLGVVAGFYQAPITLRLTHNPRISALSVSINALVFNVANTIIQLATGWLVERYGVGATSGILALAVGLPALVLGWLARNSDRGW